LYAIETEYYLASGNFIEELNQCIQASGCDFIIMGMAEKTLEQRLLGNTVIKAIHRIKKPILIIPGYIEYTGIRKMLFAYDTHKCMSWSAMNDIYYFINEFSSEIEVFNVSESIDDFAEVIQDIDLNSGYDMDDIKYSFKMIQSMKS
jgi:hypothetical protein